MIDIDRIAIGLASDLAHDCTIKSANIENLIRGAFTRGLRLGLSIRDAHAGKASPDHPQPEKAPCTPIH